MKAVEIYTDGSCLNHVDKERGRGPGGYAALLRYKKVEKLVRGSVPDAEAGAMELMAVIAGLEALKETCAVTIVTDSRYIVHGFARLKQWVQNGWQACGKRKMARKTKPRPIKNLELWQRVHAAVIAHGHKTHCRWVKSHGTDERNIRVDKAARHQARVLHQGLAE